MLAALATATACDGSDEQEEGNAIRTQKGLSVAAASAAGARANDLARGDAADAPAGRGGIEGQPQVIAEGAATSLQGLTVSGYGAATADPDSAFVEFYFGGGSSTRPGGVDGGGVAPSSPAEPETQAATLGISEADLQPVIDAIVAQGVAREDIEFLGSSYYDPIFSSATLRVHVRNLDRLGAVIQAATEASSRLSGIALQSTYVNYTLEDCAALERAALRAAKEDADARADALAEALGVSRGAALGAADYAYTPYGGTACGVPFAVPYPVGGIPYVESQAREVQLFATLTITYAMR
jgi:uncharacterized protein YggE